MANPLQLQLASSLRAWRREHGLSQEKLGEVLGVDRTYVGALERGERNPSLRVVQDIANGLGVRAIELLDGEESRKVSLPAETPALRAAKAAVSGAPADLPSARGRAARRKPTPKA